MKTYKHSSPVALALLCPLMALAADPAPSALLAGLAAGEDQAKVKMVLTKPTTTTLASVVYSFPEISILPGEIVFAEIPANMRLMSLSQLGVSHRQDERAQVVDPYPALSTLWVATTDPAATWVYWGGHASGKFGAKFAEARVKPEYDALYEWPRKGHVDLQGNKSKDPVLPQALRMQNTGKDDLLLSGLYVELIPTLATEHDVKVFSPGSDFGDPLTMKGRRYGGGQRFQGTFPQALALNSDYSGVINRNGMQVEGHKAWVDLPAGKHLISVDAMAGDTHPDRVRNKDKGWGSLGNARLSVIHVDAAGKETILREDVNVGPEGVESAFPTTPMLIKAGDRLLLKNRRGASSLYLMAVRLGFK